jgi:hypothetical protein
MIRILILLGLFTAFTANVLCAGTSAMIERHIFAPDNISNTSEEAGPAVSAPVAAALEKELLFTGVLITPKGKQAIITESTKNEPKKQKHILKEGDQVKGMTIKEIGPNYVLLAAKESNTRLNLYKGAKPRPAPIAEPAKADIPQQIAQQGTPKTEVNAKPSAPNPPQGTPKENEAPSPFGGGPKPGQPVQNNPGTASNPFTEILNKNQPLNSGNRGDVHLQLP